MCLSVIYKEKQKKDALAKLPDVITGWAVISENVPSEYSSLFFGSRLYAGRNNAKQNWVALRSHRPRIHYRAGFHRFLSHKHALKWRGGCFGSDQIMACKIHKRDITSIGKQEGMLCVVAKQIACPKYCRKKEVKK